jgi:hypothetical protein
MDKNNFIYNFETKSKDGDIKKYAILKASRRLREDGELFYSVEVSKFARAGVLPKAAWNTILSNGGGTISDKEREIYGNLLINFRDKSFELQSILIKNITERSEKEKKRSDELLEELEDIKKEIQTFESSQVSIFENTAESKARNKSILWWVLNLSYEKVDDEYSPIFEGETFDSKLDLYDAFEEDYEKYEFILGVLRRFTYLTTLWFLGRANKESEFKYFDDLFLEEKEDSETETVTETVTETTTEKATETVTIPKNLPEKEEEIIDTKIKIEETVIVEKLEEKTSDLTEKSS